MAIFNNPQLSKSQKELAYDNIDAAAKRADWIVEIMKACKYIQ